MWFESSFRIRTIAAISFCLIGPTFPAAADILHVPDDYPTIQAGIDAAVNGDEVVVADGVYTGDGNRDLDYNGKLITVRSENGPANCIIDCQGTFNDPHRGFYFHSGETNDAVLDGFTIRNGSVGDFGNETGRGGGIHCDTSSPTITNCMIVDNSVYSHFESYGGGIYSVDGSPTITNCTISGNVADSADDGGVGGGIYCNGGNPTIANCTISGNCTNAFGGFGQGGGVACFSGTATIANCTISGNTARWGGGMYNSSNSSPTLTDCTFSQNTATSSGGGMYNRYNSSPTLTDCNFSQNTATVHGGGMYNRDDSSPTLTDCTFSQNTAGYDGGGLYNYDNSSPILTDCLFTANSANDDGGAMYNSTSSPTVIRSTFSENMAVFGSSMYNADANPTVTNCTFIGNITGASGDICNDTSSPQVTNCIFSGNIAAAYGGGMFNFDNSDPAITNCTFSANDAFDGAAIHNFDPDSNPTVTNCILWGNTVVWGDANIGGDGVPTITYSNIEGGYDGTGNIDADPLFVDPDGRDYRLSSGSPSIDAGNNWGVPTDENDYDADGLLCELFPVDLDGNPRFNADEADVDPGCGVPVVVDMGAYEYQFDPADQVTFADLNGDGAVGAADLLGILVGWGPCGKGCCLADLNIDGNVGASDLLALLANWGPCP